MNPYYDSTEKTGLTKLLEFEQPDMCYEFNTFVVWRHKDGRVFFAQDSGCSCPTPFEGFTTLDKLTEVRAESIASLEADLNAWRFGRWLDSKGVAHDTYADKPHISSADVVSAIDKVKGALS